jgi:hypothetical protein
MVFFHELSKTRVTLDMSSDDANFYIDIPESITIQNGNYQLYFVLREKVSLTDANESMVGVADDPAYREVFVSDVSRGVVDERSGFQFIGSNFD